MVVSGRTSKNKTVDTQLSSMSTHGLTVTDEYLALIDAGQMWTTTTSVEVAAGTSEWILGITPAGTSIVMNGRKVEGYNSAGGIDLEIDLYKDVTCATSVGNTTSANLNHNIDELPLFLVNNNPATISGGTLVPGHMHLVSDKKSEVIGGENIMPYIMKYDSNYGLKITNNETETVTVTITWLWAEQEISV